MRFTEINARPWPLTALPFFPFLEMTSFVFIFVNFYINKNIDFIFCLLFCWRHIDKKKIKFPLCHFILPVTMFLSTTHLFAEVAIIKEINHAFVVFFCSVWSTTALFMGWLIINWSDTMELYYFLFIPQIIDMPTWVMNYLKVVHRS